jgi:transposase
MRKCLVQPLQTTKISSVEHYMKGTSSFKDTANLFGVTLTALITWVAQYKEQGTEGLTSRYTNYDIRFKMDVISYMNDTGASYLEAAAKFNIPSPQTVWKWKYLVETNGFDALQPKKNGRPSMENESKKNQPIEGSEEALRAENERLRMENTY